MNILVLGQGGREHALAWKISQSPHCQELFIAPGNGGTRDHGTNLDLDILNAEAICASIEQNEIELVMIGPEAPLAAGIADVIRERFPQVLVIGPNQSGAQLESSKAFAKSFMQRYDIPTAGYKTITSENMTDGIQYIDAMQTPIVLKADGLAAGKGVIISESHDHAKATLKDMLDGQFGVASAKVVIEEFLAGREYSVFALTDGNDHFLFPVAKDYKRIGEGDHGLNTGGMGAASPVSYIDETIMRKTVDRIIEPTLKGLMQDSIPYCGFIFFGLIEVKGEPYVIEYNCRLGDPETEVILPRIESDLVEHFIASATGKIDQNDFIISSKSCATVMMVSGGYPMKYEKGKQIHGLEQINESIVFHAGTQAQDNAISTNGGRVLAVTSIAADVDQALETCYKEIKHINFDKQYYRSDIGFDL